jgi:hypothetical protein
MQNVILFGAGFYGKGAYDRLKNKFNIMFYIDNNHALWGEKVNGLDVKSIECLNDFEAEEAKIVICTKSYPQIAMQLSTMGIDEYYIFLEGFLYHTDKYESMMPIEIESCSYYKNIDDKKSILYVQNASCIRTHKIALAVKNMGYKVYLAYSTNSPLQSNSEYANIYDGIFPIISMESLIDFVNKSDFKYVHSSNEPDFLTVLLTRTNKTIIHDCHDLSSAYKSMTPEEMELERLANVESDGVIYTTEGIRQEALRKFNIEKEKTFVLENLITEELEPTEIKEKKSKMDGKLHCVYEGGVIGNDSESHRYFEKIWYKIADSGIVVHFYTNYDLEYCRYLESLHPNIHYEGNRTSKELANELTQYDVGLCILNVTPKNRQYLEFASPNKIQEYVNAGIPVAVGDIESQREFVETNLFGSAVDMKGDLKTQITEISQINISKGVLREKGFTLESRIPQLLQFYNECSQRKKDDEKSFDF